MGSEVEVEIVDIREDSLQDIPENCKSCVYWEFPEEFKDEEARVQRKSEFENKKREWFIQTLKEFGTCGKIVYCNGKPVGYAQYAPSKRFLKVNEYKSKPAGKIEEGVVLLSCLHINDENLRGVGLGEKLLGIIIDDLRRRGFKTIETFARRSDAKNPSGPMVFYIRNGFHIKDKTDTEYPLMRLYL
jgi:GNAT superfamily N-acetyltransferase